MAIDLSNPLEWNLVYREALQSDRDLPIPKFTFPVNSFEIVVGIKVSDRPNWRWGGYLVQYVKGKPSSTAQLFNDLVQVKAFRLNCLNYQALLLDNDKPLPFYCTITLPKYFRAAQVECYARNDI
jgi:hypothetical protein